MKGLVANVKKFLQPYRKKRISQQKSIKCMRSILCSDRPEVKFQPGPGSNFLAGAWGTDSGQEFLMKIAEVMKLFKN